MNQDQAVIAIRGFGRTEKVYNRADAQSRLLSLDPLHYSREGCDLVMSSILESSATRDASASRLILLDSKPQTGDMKCVCAWGKVSIPELMLTLT